MGPPAIPEKSPLINSSPMSYLTACTQNSKTWPLKFSIAVELNTLQGAWKGSWHTCSTALHSVFIEIVSSLPVEPFPHVVPDCRAFEETCTDSKRLRPPMEKGSRFFITLRKWMATYFNSPSTKPMSSCAERYSLQLSFS